MKIILIFIFTLVIPFGNLFSQSKSSFHSIRMNGATSLKTIPYYCDSIIDLRFNKEIIGTVKTGIGNTLKYAKLSEPFNSNITLLFRQLLPKIRTRERIIIILHSLLIYEESKILKEKSFCKIELEFAKVINDSLFSFGKYKIRRNRSGLDATYSHGNNIKKAIKDCILKYKKDSINQEGKYIDSSYFRSDFDFNISRKDGCYESFRDLAKNEANHEYLGSLTTLYIGSNYTRYDYKINDDKIDKKDIMFIVNDGDLFINAFQYSGKHYFVKTKQFGRYVYFEDKFKTNENGAIFGSAIGGILGGMIGSSIKGPLKSQILDTQSGEIFTIGHLGLYKLIKILKEREKIEKLQL